MYTQPDGSRIIHHLGGGAAPVPGLRPDDRVIRWCPDGYSVYLFSQKQMPYRIERMDLGSGRRQTVREYAPVDRAGVLTAWNADLTDDAQCYTYDYYRMKSQLFQVEGAH